MIPCEIIDVCEKLDWRVIVYEDDTAELEKYSPAGEDFSFTVRTDSFIADVKEYAAHFDVDEHLEMWAQARINGTSGVPSIRRLAIDAEEIDKMLQELATKLAELEE